MGERVRATPFRITPQNTVAPNPIRPNLAIMSTNAPADATIHAFWRVLAESGWHGLTMRAIAAEAAIPLATLRRQAACPFGLLIAHQRMVDAAVLAGTVEDLTSTPPRHCAFHR